LKAIMRVVFLGTADFAVPALRALAGDGHAILAVVSQPDRPAGRGRAVRPTPVHAAATELGLRHIQTEDVNKQPLTESSAPADIGVVAAFGQKIGRPMLEAVRLGCINIHASLLPKYRGAAPIQWAVINGDESTGVTVFQLNERFDAGPIWGQRSTPITETETADELHDRLAALGAALIVDTLRAAEAGTIRPVEQDPTQATRAPKLSKADGTVDWSQPAQRIVRRIHGLWSWPAAACMLAARRGKQERVLLARAQVADADACPTAEFPCGAFCEDLTVQAGKGRVRLLEVQPASGKRMSFRDFANGRRLAPPDRLAPVPT
jgi:methionyl-tRNA formyltransferase